MNRFKEYRCPDCGAIKFVRDAPDLATAHPRRYDYSCPADSFPDDVNLTTPRRFYGTTNKKRSPFVTDKDKKRLKIFNEAMEKLQNVIPVRLPKGRKLQKKQTLQFAIKYIEFLQSCIDGKNDFNDRYRFLWVEGTEHDDAIHAIDEAALKSSGIDSTHY